ncbi:hypothetical protein CXG81DRAFT_23717 [Caulochytrium protostelioides]|uniref:Uncharacterized protein n=1 Tax=Caulochytrium protostelioides TaxID=1555241 RepID=A0A4P9XDP0_9FUNG|nr:hypothetical protein CXG81DRAFT_23717 [Caulochytrium protostelioides]|eukprot:RKP03605.1 hypothetical protein CXG81DRAFT_23717 [Caulochytrium protostelioides]
MAALWRSLPLAASGTGSRAGSRGPPHRAPLPRRTPCIPFSGRTVHDRHGGRTLAVLLTVALTAVIAVAIAEAATAPAAAAAAVTVFQMPTASSTAHPTTVTLAAPPWPPAEIDTTIDIRDEGPPVFTRRDASTTTASASITSSSPPHLEPRAVGPHPAPARIKTSGNANARVKADAESIKTLTANQTVSDEHIDALTADFLSVRSYTTWLPNSDGTYRQVDWADRAGTKTGDLPYWVQQALIAFSMLALFALWHVYLHLRLRLDRRATSRKKGFAMHIPTPSIRSAGDADLYDDSCQPSRALHHHTHTMDNTPIPLRSSSIHKPLGEASPWVAMSPLPQSPKPAANLSYASQGRPSATFDGATTTATTTATATSDGRPRKFRPRSRSLGEHVAHVDPDTQSRTPRAHRYQHGHPARRSQRLPRLSMAFWHGDHRHPPPDHDSDDRGVVEPAPEWEGAERADQQTTLERQRELRKRLRLSGIVEIGRDALFAGIGGEGLGGPPSETTPETTARAAEPSLDYAPHGTWGDATVVTIPDGAAAFLAPGPRARARFHHGPHADSPHPAPPHLPVASDAYTSAHAQQQAHAHPRPALWAGARDPALLPAATVPSHRGQHAAGPPESPALVASASPGFHAWTESTSSGVPLGEMLPMSVLSPTSSASAGDAASPTSAARGPRPAAACHPHATGPWSGPVA